MIVFEHYKQVASQMFVNPDRAENSKKCIAIAYIATSQSKSTFEALDWIRSKVEEIVPMKDIGMRWILLRKEIGADKEVGNLKAINEQIMRARRWAEEEIVEMLCNKCEKVLKSQEVVS